MRTSKAVPESKETPAMEARSHSAGFLKKAVMAKLSTSARKAIPSSEFGLPGKRAYPMPDKSHAGNAKARATQMVSAGKLSSSAAAKIRAKANAILGGK